MPSRLLDELSRQVLLLDGAMGTSIHARDLDLDRDYLGRENCTDVLVKSRPDVIQEIHESFLAAGADAVETDTFGANPLVLGEFGLADETEALNRAGAEIARAACRRFETPDRPRFVIGSMGPGTRLVTLGNTDWDTMLGSYRRQVRGLLSGGVDALLIETCQDLLQVKCAINACLAELDHADLDAGRVPILVSVTMETTGTMLLGTSIEAVVTALGRFPIASLGLNCATGPTEMVEHVRYLARSWPGTVSVVPNAGLPALVEGRTEYPLGPEAFAEALIGFVERFGVGIVGGCCGTTPEHIRQLAERLSEVAAGAQVSRPAGRSPAGAGSVVQVEEDTARRAAARVAPSPGCTSLYSVTEYRQETSFLIVGERCNASGSRKFKRLLEGEDWDGIVSLAREQVRDGSHVLDVNVDYAGRDNAADMGEIVRRLVRQVDVPLMLDSTQSGTIEAGLKCAPGKCIINSANFEDGNDKFDLLCTLARRYNAALVIGSIDEDEQSAMARTADRKVAIAERGFERAVSIHGIDPADLFFDPLVLPISTGMDADRRSALELIDGVGRIAERFDRSQIVCGVSNVSFGLKPAARVVLNSALLHELVEAGLTSAIVHSSKILPRNRVADEQWAAALDLIYDRRRKGFDPLSAFIDLFRDAAAVAESGPNKENLTLEERLRAHIIDGEKEGLVEALDEARRRYSPLEIINEHLLDGMKTVGDLFGSGQMQLPFVLQSAAVMKAAVGHLEQFMERADGQSKGTIVLATVKGDVHDIGKNLVDIILTNNGYTVHNLGIKQPIGSILSAFQEHNADAIGLSGLLVKSVTVMEENLRELNERGVSAPVLLGGAALSRHYCEGHLRGIYQGQCFYGKDAFDGLRIMDHVAGGRTEALVGEIECRLSKRAEAERVIERGRADRAAADSAERPGATGVAARSDVARDVPIPNPPFWGSRVVEEIDLVQVYRYINEVALFRGQWHFRKGAMSDEQYEDVLHDTVRPIFDRLKAQCTEERILRPKAVYGYFPCNADGDDLIVFDPDNPGREVERFTFPRQVGRKRLCISDFFRDVASEERDVVAFHCVTMGEEVSTRARALFEGDDYSEYLYLHGLGVEAAEALAELWHQRIRRELGIAGDDARAIRSLFTQHYRGSQYSFGYPACPEMSDQEKLFGLLDPGRIGCALTENWQIDPEQSTSAIIVHHPEAKYFNV